jgi:hypothetical protein
LKFDIFCDCNTFTYFSLEEKRTEESLDLEVPTQPYAVVGPHPEVRPNEDPDPEVQPAEDPEVLRRVVGDPDPVVRRSSSNAVGLDRGVRSESVRLNEGVMTVQKKGTGTGLVKYFYF